MYSRQIAGDNDTITIVAGETITAHRLVDFEGKHTVSVAAMGVALFNTDSGDNISVGVAPIEVVESGGTCTAGGALEADANGCVVDYSSGVVIGRAIDAASGAGEFIRVRMFVQ